jgi:hypothetical protein
VVPSGVMVLAHFSVAHMSEEAGEACAFDNADELVVAVEDVGADTPEQDALIQSLLATIPALIAAHPSPQGEPVYRTARATACVTLPVVLGRPCVATSS